MIPSKRMNARRRPSSKLGRRRYDCTNSRYSILPFIALRRSSISALTASRLKLAPRCIGGYSMNVWAYSPTFCCRKTKRQNSWLVEVRHVHEGAVVALRRTAFARTDRAADSIESASRDGPCRRASRRAGRSCDTSSRRCEPRRAFLPRNKRFRGGWMGPCRSAKASGHSRRDGPCRSCRRAACLTTILA